MKNFVNENADFVATCAFSVPERRDLRFGSVHPKNRFLSLFLVKPTFFLLYFPDVTKTSFSLCSNRDLSISRA